MIKGKEGKSMCPRKPKKPCSLRGCPELTDDRYCTKHNKLFNNKRDSAASRGYDSRWRAASKRYLSNNPLCVHCFKNNKMIKATVVDHVIPHRGDKILFWDQSNWQSLCKRCHDKKTMTEDRYQEYSF
jgi:5-methylcytosine-specific restriction protein A